MGKYLTPMLIRTPLHAPTWMFFLYNRILQNCTANCNYLMKVYVICKDFHIDGHKFNNRIWVFHNFLQRYRQIQIIIWKKINKRIQKRKW